ncbi:MAG: hypothetical protein IH830_04845 [Planctomycetes bacterium]|nr:hypothetical protein [Planctomycetota bacterium]
MNGKLWCVALGVVWTAAGSGCASGSDPADAGRDHVRFLSSSLVMPTPALRGDGAQSAAAWPVDQRHWEYARNDAPLSVSTTPRYRRTTWAEIRTLDRLRTTNGRPREFSTTTIRTIHHPVVR